MLLLSAQFGSMLQFYAALSVRTISARLSLWKPFPWRWHIQFKVQQCVLVCAWHDVLTRARWRALQCVLCERRSIFGRWFSYIHVYMCLLFLMSSPLATFQGALTAQQPDTKFFAHNFRAQIYAAYIFNFAQSTGECIRALEFCARTVRFTVGGGWLDCCLCRSVCGALCHV